MKKIIIALFCLSLTAVLVGCGGGADTPADTTANQTDVSQTNVSQTDVQTDGVWKARAVNGGEEIVLSPEDTETLKSHIAGCKYFEAVADCLNDYEFEREDGSIIYYHSDCGTFNDNEAMKSYTLLDWQKEWVNGLLGVKPGASSLPLAEIERPDLELEIK